MIHGGWMFFGWFLITILTIVVAFNKEELRSRMLWAGLLSLPLLLIKPLISDDFANLANSSDGILLFFLQRAIVAFSFAALAASIYEIFFHKKISPVRHPLRPKLIWLFSGLVIFVILKVIFDQSFIASLVAALVTDIVCILFLRKDLIWDAIFSGFSMSVLYLLIFIVTFRGFPGDLYNFWFTDHLTGITLFSLPIEELLAVMLYGALWGPLYIAIKDLKEK